MTEGPASEPVPRLQPNHTSAAHLEVAKLIKVADAGPPKLHRVPGGAMGVQVQGIIWPCVQQASFLHSCCQLLLQLLHSSIQPGPRIPQGSSTQTPLQPLLLTMIASAGGPLRIAAAFKPTDMLQRLGTSVTATTLTCRPDGKHAKPVFSAQ